MVWLYMYIYIYIKPKLCSKKQCTHSCLARAVKCWSSAVPAAHGLTQANPTNHLYLEYIHDFMTGWWYTYPSDKYESQLG